MSHKEKRLKRIEPWRMDRRHVRDLEEGERFILSTHGKEVIARVESVESDK